MNKKAAINRINRDHCYLAGIFSVLVLLAVVYMYLLSATVVHVVMQKEMRGEINSLYSEISGLEAEYIAKQHSVSEELATLEGFLPAEDKIFIERGDSSLVLSTNGL